MHIHTYFPKHLFQDKSRLNSHLPYIPHLLKQLSHIRIITQNSYNNLLLGAQIKSAKAGFNLCPQNEQKYLLVVGIEQRSGTQVRGLGSELVPRLFRVTDEEKVEGDKRTRDPTGVHRKYMKTAFNFSGFLLRCAGRTESSREAGATTLP